jgi:small nuclear ribonucleoprotein (snRNP)-like protein
MPPFRLIDAKRGEDSMQKMTGAFTAVIAISLAVLVAVFVYQNALARAVPELTTPYHAVALTNGQVYFGRIESLDGTYTVLRDVFYIQSRVNSETKQVSNLLVKRGGEWHGPDRMIVNKQHVVLIEPVKDDSQVAKLIAEQTKAR